MSEASVPVLSLTADKTYGVYIHIPFCKAKCRYCAFVSVPDLSLQGAYIDALVQEIEHSSARGAAVDTVYIGGGTPSCLYSGAVSRILDAVARTFCVSAGAEITVEANPESCGESFVGELRACGANRVSMGLQSCDDAVLKSIGRLHTRDGFLRALGLLRDAGIKNISTDIILGLPGQPASDAKACIGAVCDACDHISVYALTVEEGTPLYGKYLPDDDAVADMYEAAVRELSRRGYTRYEVSNFARAGRESRHNSKYWSCAPYLGFGAAAHGYDGERMRYSHTEDVRRYISGAPVIYTPLSDTDMINEYIMLRLRTERGIALDDFEKRFNASLFSIAGDSISRLEKQGLIAVTDDRVSISPQKMFVMNGIIEELML